jgi:hypothetical protein
VVWSENCDNHIDRGNYRRRYYRPISVVLKEG